MSNALHYVKAEAALNIERHIVHDIEMVVLLTGLVTMGLRGQ